jgi:aminopeptidase YwaD
LSGGNNIETECDRAQAYLSILCNSSPHRRTGSPGNRVATKFFAARVRELGYEIDTTPFDCLDWESGRISLTSNGETYRIYTSPYSPGANLSAPVVTVTTIGELEVCDCRGKILLLKGEIAAEQLMPKNFFFYNPDHHKLIYALLEQKRPAAVITATAMDPNFGALYPFPMIEDGDFDIPSVYCTDFTGEAIATFNANPFRLVIEARRIPSTSSNVIARKNPGAQNKIVACAHIDAKEGTPGATDNASGVVVLLLLAEKLADYTGQLGVELVAINGEDHYSAGGEMDYLRRYGDELGNVALAINIDGAGYIEGKTAFSIYGLPPEMEASARSIFNRFAGLVDGDPWYQGDHMMFVQAGRPSLAFTSEKAMEMLSTVTHSDADTPEIVDCRKLVELAAALNSFIRAV